MAALDNDTLQLTTARIGSGLAMSELDEEQRVLLWRFEQLVAAGYPEGGAARVAEDGALDLEQARRLRRLGCPAELALEILL